MSERNDSISAGELKARLEKKEVIHLLDVRTKEEREERHIGGIWIPLDQLSERYHELPAAPEIIVYCRSGRRSQAAVDMLRESGFPESKNLMGGIWAWFGEN
jgi:rhodanese-related sulfurtransferase